MCYVFIAVFPFMILIPSYPLAVGFIYLLSCYPVLFLGANKGQQSNDLLFSTLLPVRKKDIVLARILTVIIMQVAYMIIMSCLYPVALFIDHSIQYAGEPNVNPGIPLSGYVSILGIGIIGFAIADLIYFSIYYKHGKSILASTLLTILGFIIYLGIFTIGLSYVPGLHYNEFLAEKGLLYQFIVLTAGILISALLHFVTYRIASNELEKVDF